MMNPLVSVVIPVFNVEPYLQRCLESLRAQTLAGIEIICINDASSDGSGAVLAACAKQDKRIQIITHKANLGVGAARNSGMAAAKASYIYFLDSDDWLEGQALEKLYKAITQSSADYVYFNATAYHEADGSYCPMGFFKGKTMRVLTGRALAKARGRLPHNVWACIFSRQFLQNSGFQFPAGVYAEDTAAFILQLLAKSIAVLPYTGYYYRKRASSISGSFATMRYIGDIVKVNAFCKSFMESHGLLPYYSSFLRKLCAWHLFYIGTAQSWRLALADQKALADLCLQQRDAYSVKLTDFCGFGGFPNKKAQARFMLFGLLLSLNKWGLWPKSRLLAIYAPVKKL